VQYVTLIVERLGVPISTADVGFVEDVLLRKLDFRLSVQAEHSPVCALKKKRF
jgi:hypothetical protein